MLYADFKHRLGSGLVDYIPTIGVPWLLLDGTAWFVVTTLLVLANSGVYQGMTGQSVGKKLLRLQLVYPVVPAADPDDMATALVPGVGRTILRQFLHIFDTLPLFYGFYRVSTDRRHRTFADSWVGTDVMRAENKLINLMDDPRLPPTPCVTEGSRPDPQDDERPNAGRCQGASSFRARRPTGPSL